MLMLSSRSADFFSKFNFSKNSFRNTIRVSNGWIQIRTDLQSVLIWIQTVCKGYQLTARVATSDEKLKQTSSDMDVNVVSQKGGSSVRELQGGN